MEFLNKNFKKELKKIKTVYKLYRFIKDLPKEIRKQLRNDVYIVSPPKAGRTWLKVLLSKIASITSNSPFELNLFKKLENNLYPNIEFTHDLAAPEMRLETLRFRKWKYLNKKIIFISRDPRDVIVSYYFEIKKRYSSYDGDISKFIRDPNYGIERVVNFMNMWIQNKDNVEELKLIKYEDMHKNLKSVLKLVINFLNIPNIPNRVYKKAISFSRFNNMHKLEKNNYFSSDALRPGDVNDPESYKTRKGKIGGFRDYLEEQDINYVNDKLKELDSRFNYN